MVLRLKFLKNLDDRRSFDFSPVFLFLFSVSFYILSVPVETSNSKILVDLSLLLLLIFCAGRDWPRCWYKTLYICTPAFVHYRCGNPAVPGLGHAPAQFVRDTDPVCSFIPFPGISLPPYLNVPLTLHLVVCYNQYIKIYTPTGPEILQFACIWIFSP